MSQPAMMPKPLTAAAPANTVRISPTEQVSLPNVFDIVCIEVPVVLNNGIDERPVATYTLQLQNMRPAMLTPPFVFDSCAVPSALGTVSNLTITPRQLPFQRVQMDVDIPLIIYFTDALGNRGAADAVVTVHEDFITPTPNQSIFPAVFEVMVGAECLGGSFLDMTTLQVQLCVAVLVKLVSEQLIRVVTAGNCPINAIEHTEDQSCEEFFAQDLYPSINNG